MTPITVTVDGVELGTWEPRGLAALERNEEVKTMTITIDRLAELEQERTVAQRAASEATDRRNEAIAALLAQGVTQTAIALRLGVSPGRVSQIASRSARAAA